LGLGAILALCFPFVESQLANFFLGWFLLNGCTLRTFTAGGATTRALLAIIRIRRAIQIDLLNDPFV
jgi:hypothetical protein